MTEKRFTVDSDGKYLDKIKHEYVTIDGLFRLVEEQDKMLNALHEENEQLKQRNTNQSEQLHRLYTLIEKKDWRVLTDIIDDFQQCEEQLQREWECYE